MDFGTKPMLILNNCYFLSLLENVDYEYSLQHHGSKAKSRLAKYLLSLIPKRDSSVERNRCLLLQIIPVVCEIFIWLPY